MNGLMKLILGLLVVVTPVVAYADKDLTKNGTWDCKKDGTVHIANGSGKFVFKGKCKLISVGGGENKLSIDSVDKLDVGGGENNISAKTVTTLTVGGAENQISVDTLGSLDVGGTDNKIVFKKAIKGDVKVTGQPQANTVVGAGKVISAASAGASAPPTGGSATGGSATGGSTTATAGVDVNAVAGVDVNALTGGAGTVTGGGATATGGGTIDCAKTPTFAYNDNGGEFTLKGKCDKIAINGNNVKLKVESAKSVSLDGNNNKVDVIAVDSISTNGNNNSVTYKKALTASAKVKVSNPGNGNTIKLMK